ncbi:hypothetical protein [Flavobacterium sp. '19STA2R22 D10 B1']|uniref:hypothetical protein n=1 Tax=Flavobacterium aerium TaxID=3037261 RepID=UPI00278C8C3B|nr:hypothetical protein [Flavobacterium sp. '19STA2R22 D10 B1']
MGYRRSYYRKDGTYVSDSFDSRGSNKTKSFYNTIPSTPQETKYNNRGCFGVMLIVILSFIVLYNIL